MGEQDEKRGFYKCDTICNELNGHKGIYTEETMSRRYRMTHVSDHELHLFISLKRSIASCIIFEEHVEEELFILKPDNISMNNNESKIFITLCLVKKIKGILCTPLSLILQDFLHENKHNFMPGSWYLFIDKVNQDHLCNLVYYPSYSHTIFKQNNYLLPLDNFLFSNEKGVIVCNQTAGFTFLHVKHTVLDCIEEHKSILCTNTQDSFNSMLCDTNVVQNYHTLYAVYGISCRILSALYISLHKLFSLVLYFFHMVHAIFFCVMGELIHISPYICLIFVFYYYFTVIIVHP